MNKQLLKLRKMILALEETETDKGILIHEGELAEGIEVFIEDAEGLLQPAEDGEYLAEDKIIIVAEGKVAEIRDKEPEQPEQEPEEQPEEQQLDEETEAQLAEKDARIAELEGIVADRDARIAELEAENEELKAKLAESDARSAEEELKMSKVNKPNNSIKFDLYK